MRPSFPSRRHRPRPLRAARQGQSASSRSRSARSLWRGRVDAWCVLTRKRSRHGIREPWGGVMKSQLAVKWRASQFLSSRHRWGAVTFKRQCDRAATDAPYSEEMQSRASCRAPVSRFFGSRSTERCMKQETCWPKSGGLGGPPHWQRRPSIRLDLPPISGKISFVEPSTTLSSTEGTEATSHSTRDRVSDHGRTRRS